LTLAAVQGTDIVIRLNGPDEAAAGEALAELLNNKFGEKE